MVGEQTFKNSDSSFSSQVAASVVRTEPDCIFLPTIAPGA